MEYIWVISMLFQDGIEQKTQEEEYTSRVLIMQPSRGLQKYNPPASSDSQVRG